MMLRVVVHPGRTLWEELAEQNIVLDRPCGGKGSCGRCSVVLRDGRTVLACQYRTAGEVEIEELPESASADGAQAGITAIGTQRDRGVGKLSKPVAAVDIGTTTVVIKLLYQDYIIEKSFINPQRLYGLDVMSRICAEEEGHGGELNRLIREQLQAAIRELEEKLSLKDMGTEGLQRMVVSANTTMQHLLEGLSCAGLGKAPFLPERLDLRSFFMDGMQVVQLPGISAFVGADVVSGLAAIDILHGRKPVLFVDLGTNGEMALGCEKRLLVTSTAAGPAFEGSALAVRLHAAGVLALLHRLLEGGVIDAYGTLEEQYFDSGYPVDAACTLTQEEIRELQMAKAAVCAGIEMLLEEYGITAGEVEQVYLAGGFGYYLDPEDALAVGLLPEGLRGRITAAGNTSLEGAVLYAADPESCGPRMEEICRRAELLSLPDREGFEERYIARMNFGLYSD